MKTQTAKFPANRLSNTFLPILWFASITLILSSCATQTPVKEDVVEEKDLGVYVWPAPPEQERIRYVESLSVTAEAANAELTFVDKLTGAVKKLDRDKTLERPKDVYVDADGRVFVTDSAPEVLVVFDRANEKVGFWGKEGMGKLTSATGITGDSAGRIYVSDGRSQRVVVFNKNGGFELAFGGKDIFINPVGIAIDEDNERVYVADAGKHKIFVFDMQGNLVSEFGGQGAEPGQFNRPSFLALSSNGKLYVADSMNFRIQVFSLDGKFESTWGSIGRVMGQFNRLKGIALDSENNVYAVDASFNNFQIFDETGTSILLWVGEGEGSPPGYFDLPVGIHIDHKNNIYVADSLNKRVQIFKRVDLPVEGPTDANE
jgi:DNA-binding beta-propeller fold protein YncE